MRKALALFAFALPLAGCLQPVDIYASRADVGSPTGPKDASVVVTPPDATVSTFPDAGPIAPDAAVVACILSSDCPVPLNPGCTASCEQGKCVEHCATLCTTDLACHSGQVCVADCAGVKTCVQGCRDSSTCPAHEICQPVMDKCGNDFGTCVEGPACTSESDCPLGTACDFDMSRGIRACIPGCHTDANCPTGEKCPAFACPMDCVACPCVGQCYKTAKCASDAECLAGEVCIGLHYQTCDAHCVAGCHLDTDCRPDEQCAPPPPCASCECEAGSCVPRPPTCTGNADCKKGEICSDNAACFGPRHCIAGCFVDTDCTQGEACMQADCACCAGVCAPKPSCASDSECGAGYVCESVDHFGCSGAKSCQPGCHPGQACADGSACLAAHCGACCPGTCAPPACTSDGQCGIGQVCELGLNGYECVPGCHDSSQCWPGDQCTPVYCDTIPCPPQCSPAVTSCTNDGACGLGRVCEPAGPGCTTAKVCTTGCRSGADCRPNQVCSQPACLTCPCPGTCVTTSCPGGASTCAGAMDCPWKQSFCDTGCCTGCPVLVPPQCPDPSQVLLDQGLDANGCKVAPKCGAACVCPQVLAPVCAVVPKYLPGNYQTYGNECEATCAGASVLHPGACLDYEGLGCGYPWGPPQSPCAAGQYCRDTCPMCDSIQEARCTKSGACLDVWDCPAGLAASCPTSQNPTWSCVNNGCQYTCQ